jgi:CheY-like chemotaxis protein/Skp family chaperone for outer membrane proteins
MPALIMAVVTALAIGFLAYEGQEPTILGVVAVLGAVGIGLIVWARSAAGAEAARLKAAGVARDTRLAGIQAEADRLRGELTRAVSQQREVEEQARTASTAAAERQKQQDATIREGRAEIDRLRKEVEQARRQPPSRTAEAPSAPAPAPGVKPAETPPRQPAAAAAPPRPAVPPPPAAPPRPAPTPPVAPPRPSAPPPAPPVAEPAAQAPPPAVAAVPPGKREPDPAPGDALGTVLLVDDDASFLFVAANILRPAGFRVIEADSGQSALNQAGQQTGKIDLLITDMMMPGMNGRQLAQRFTKLRPGVRVLYVSGFVDEGSAREAIAGEEADFLAKPFEAEAFTAKVRELTRAASRP